MPRSAIKRFTREEAGAATVFSLFMFITLAMLLGIMVDASNAWRNRTFLMSVADIAAHGAAIKLGQGGTNAEVIGEAARLVRANLNTTQHRDILDETTDVQIAHYDPATGEISASGDMNAVIVRLEKSIARGNPVSTYLLRFAGVETWEMDAVGVAVYDMVGICDYTDGIFAKGQITLTSDSHIGSGVCLHSEDRVWLPQRNYFGEYSVVSMPDLDDCVNKCEEEANPGIYATESHDVFPDFRLQIQASYDGFASTTGLNEEKNMLFASVTNQVAFAAGQQTLIDAGLIDEVKPVGTVVPLTLAEFETLEWLPSGLVYEIDCPTSGSGPTTQLIFDGTKGKMDDAAVITNCNIHFDDGSYVVGSVVITTRISASATVTAGSSVTVGDPTNSCDAGNRTTIMSMSKVNVPAEFTLSNVTIVAGDDITLASATTNGFVSKGIALYSQNEIHIASQHSFASCGDTGNELEPDLKSLRLVIPNLTATVVAML